MGQMGQQRGEEGGSGEDGSSPRPDLGKERDRAVLVDRTGEGVLGWDRWDNRGERNCKRSRGIGVPALACDVSAYHAREERVHRSPVAKRAQDEVNQFIKAGERGVGKNNRFVVNSQIEHRKLSERVGEFAIAGCRRGVRGSESGRC